MRFVVPRGESAGVTGLPCLCRTPLSLRCPEPALRAPALNRYDALFSIEMARRQLKSDIENSIDQIKERLLATRLDPRTTTLRELMENELRPEVYGPEKCRDRASACHSEFSHHTYSHYDHNKYVDALSPDYHRFAPAVLDLGVVGPALRRLPPDSCPCTCRQGSLGGHRAAVDQPSGTYTASILYW